MKAGIKKDVHVHILRHTLATYLVNNGWHIIHVKEKMRHSDIGTTAIYSHSNSETQRSMTKTLGDDLLACSSVAE
jgi:site-specific recombinase XerD